MVGRDGAEPAGLEVLERLRELVLGVHDERAVGATGSPIGRPPSSSTSRVGVRESWAVSAATVEAVPGAEHGQLPGADGPALGRRPSRSRPARRPAR